MKRMLRWGGTGVAVLVVPVAVVWAVGSQLPVEHRASGTRTVPADIDLVWDRVEDVQGWPEWQELEVQPLGEDSARVRQDGETLLYRLERPAPRTLVTRIVGEDLPFGGAWTWSAAPAGDGTTEVTIVEDGEVYDPIYRFFSRYVFGHEASIRRALDALEASFADQR